MLVNVRTAQPVLRYLLAEAGFEPPLVPVREGWDIFKRFLSMPATAAKDRACLQTSWIRENPAEPVFSFVVCRQLTDDPTGVDVRTIGLNFLFDPADSRLTEDELWAEDYGGLDLFFRKVENSPAFAYALGATPTLGDVLEQEE